MCLTVSRSDPVVGKSFARALDEKQRLPSRAPTSSRYMIPLKHFWGMNRMMHDAYFSDGHGTIDALDASPPTLCTASGFRCSCVILVTPLFFIRFEVAPPSPWRIACYRRFFLFYLRLLIGGNGSIKSPPQFRCAAWAYTEHCVLPGNMIRSAA